MPILKVIALGYSLLKKEHLYLLKFKCDLQDFVYHLQNGLGKSQIKIIFTLKPISGCSQWLWLLSMQNGNIPSVAYKWYPPWGEMDSSVPWDRLVIHTTAHTDVKHIMLDSKACPLCEFMNMVSLKSRSMRMKGTEQRVSGDWGGEKLSLEKETRKFEGWLTGLDVAIVVVIWLPGLAIALRTTCWRQKSPAVSVRF